MSAIAGAAALCEKAVIVLAAAVLLGVCAGLRTFTAPAVLWLLRHSGPAAWILAVLAVLEYAADLHPKAPPRTGVAGLFARMCSGAFCGGALLGSAGHPLAAGVIAGALGAIAGAYGGLWLRLRAMRAVGHIPAALLEDGAAIIASAAVVLWR